MEKQMSQGSRELHKSRQALKVLQTDSETPAALGRTNIKKSLVILPCGKTECGVPWRSPCPEDAACSGWAVRAAGQPGPVLCCRLVFTPQSQPCPQVLFGTSCLVPTQPHNSLCWFCSPRGSLPSGPGVLIILRPTVGLVQK